MKFWPFKTPDPGRLAVGNFNLTAQLPNGRSIQVAGYVYSDDSPAEVDARLDLCQLAIERQMDRCEIPVLEATVDQRMKGIEQAREVLADLEQRQLDGAKLTSQEQMNVKNMRVNLAKQMEDIDKGREEIAQRKRKAGVR